MDTISYYGPQILVITTLILLLPYKHLFSYYIYGYVLCFIFKKILKDIIKDERPYTVPESKYNMPSGHCMLSFFSIAFVIMLLYNKINIDINYKLYIVLFYILIALNTIYSCIKYNYNTIDQLLIGVIIGTIVGYYYYYFVIA